MGRCSPMLVRAKPGTPTGAGRRGHIAADRSQGHRPMARSRANRIVSPPQSPAGGGAHEAARIGVDDRRRGGMADGGRCATAPDAGNRLPERRGGRVVDALRARVPVGPRRGRIHRGAERADRVSLGQRPIQPPARIGGRSRPAAGERDRRHQHAGGPSRQAGHDHDTDRLRHRQRSGGAGACHQLQPSRRQHHRRHGARGPRWARNAWICSASCYPGRRDWRRSSTHPDPISGRSWPT